MGDTGTTGMMVVYAQTRSPLTCSIVGFDPIFYFCHVNIDRMLSL
jgi:hypothetical protein